MRHRERPDDSSMARVQLLTLLGTNVKKSHWRREAKELENQRQRNDPIASVTFHTNSNTTMVCKSDGFSRATSI